ncbi:MAG TPA: helix-turn-helix domain-containing protein [Thermoanaerobaculaceae bacterium]|nr:helix-turn-helix domain-containing protein [Thermoanaerobaculaceae bacterium]HRS16833.1 helix-turn-helix domain-containing protein [Thermoanaerobaculaceae bacterium]
MRPGVRALVLVVLLAPASLLGAGGLEVPYRQRELRIDGALEDWEGQGLEVSFADPDRRGNTAAARLAWDRETLYAAFAVVDAEVFVPPPDVPAAAVYQWDSVELYVGVEARATPRMTSGDFQIIVSSGGAVVALRGDDLLQSAGWKVPKRVQGPLAARAAARRTADGYQVELAVPWPALGLETARAGRVLRIDLACNDWLEDHAQLPEAVIDFDTIEQLRQAMDPDKTGLRLDDPEHLGWRAGRAILERAYLAWSWSGTRDLGYPDAWHEVRLAGSPPWRDRAVETLGAGGIGALAAVLTAAFGATAVLAVRRRARRRIAALMESLRALEHEKSAGERQPASREQSGGGVGTPREPPEKPAYDSLSGKIDQVQVLVHRGDPVPREVRSRAIAYVIRHLDDPVTPAEVAAGVHVSLRTLQRALLTSLGCTPRELVMAVRMREAQRLLRVEGLLVKEVAARVGFVSASHFSRTYKHYYRVAPSEVPGGPARSPGLG